MYIVTITNQFKIFSDFENDFVIATDIKDDETETLLKQGYDEKGNFYWGVPNGIRLTQYIKIMLNAHLMFLNGRVVKDRYGISATTLSRHEVFDMLLMASFKSEE